MLYSVKGKLIHTEPGIAVVECGGVGFKCFVTMHTQRNLPKLGEEAMLFTHLNVREDAMDLFGFYSRSEMSCFKDAHQRFRCGAQGGAGHFERAFPGAGGHGRGFRG